MTQQPPAFTPSRSPLTPHLDFIKEQIPTWLIKAPAQVREDFRNSLIKSNQARHDLKDLLGTIQSPQEFARALLHGKIRIWFFGLVTNEDAILSREWKNHHLLGLIKNHAKTTRQTLLEAALQNFEASEAETGGMEIGTVIFNQTDSGEVPSTVCAPCSRAFVANWISAASIQNTSAMFSSRRLPRGCGGFSGTRRSMPSALRCTVPACARR
ncbi:hypothetical protein VRC24_02495 [Pseudomonas poae]|uniref:hypothetical protein n=1 Tax=Pseudomonas poae TaxID=200451 RepID=UPI0030D3CC98